ncbi:hypothetical protein CROQUDRAFT_659906 [Cronartium quercuum f. sp. fusiforme G11]|uniref:Spc7 kinetochore protein domain-containing protein n=1 Tax=Cronartium quercuum f. sp. fusiforme G11 TaxID=708437 RepID=A0A9P6TAB5_9BASI|nr:hypothetical protein CROQUDRAFT_659906 [Cronartium quercuum f. sp. fusiforme G11]
MATTKPIPRLSIPSASTNPSPLSAPTIKITHQKRSKSLGGALSNHSRSQENLTEPLELTPRKKARRSLVPGKSILKSRPTVTGLERNHSDSLMTFGNAHTLPITHSNSLPSDLNGPAYASQSQQSGLARADTLLIEGPARVQPKPTPDENAQSDASSDMDMDLSTGAASPRFSMASNTTTSYPRRVSFATKAFVRTFGSPIAGPSSSSPAASPSQNDDRPPASDGVDEESAEMSIDEPTLPEPVRPPPPLPPAASPSSAPTASKNGVSGSGGSKSLESLGFGAGARLLHQPRKPSRLSTVLNGLDPNDLDDDDDEAMDEGEDSLLGRVTAAADAPSPSPARAASPAAIPGSAPIAPSVDASLSKPPSSTRPVLSEVTHDANLTGSSVSALQTSTNVVRPSQIPRYGGGGSSASASLGVGREQANRRQSTTADLLKRLKSSRLSMAFPEYAREDADETENVGSRTGETRPHRPSLAPAPTSSLTTERAPAPEKSVVPSATQKSSRLTLAFPEYADGDDTVISEDAKGSVVRQSLGPPAILAHSRASGANQISLAPTLTSSSSSSTKERVDVSEKITGPVAQKSSRLTLAFPEYADGDETVVSEDPKVEVSGPGVGSSKPSRLTLSLFPEYLDDLDEEEDHEEVATSEKQDSAQNGFGTKSSRLSFALNGQEHPELDETMDLDDQPSALDPVRKQPSRLSEFFSADDGLNESADLIDLHDLSLEHPLPVTTGGKPIDQSETEALSMSSHALRQPAPVPGAKTSTGPVSIFPDSSASSAGPVAMAEESERGPQPSDSPPIQRPVLPLAPLVFHRRTSASPSKRPTPQRQDSRFPSPRRSMKPSTLEPPLPLLAGRSRRSSFLVSPPINPPVAPPSPSKLNTSQAPPPPPPPPPPPAFTLEEFFQQAELRFINLAQPQVRADEQGLTTAPTGELASLSAQVYAGMVKIPRLRMLETAGRTLRSKTESLDLITTEHGTILESNPDRSKLINKWLELRKDEGVGTDGLISLLERLRLEKTGAELKAKRNGLEFERRNLVEYRLGLQERRERLGVDLELMRGVGSVVGPSMDDLRAHKLKLAEEINMRKAKNEEIEKCDQGLLEALKAEMKDLGMAVEVMRGTLAESEFEKNLWKEKMEVIEDEKRELANMIEEWERRGDGKGNECTTHDLVRMKNEFTTLQKMMGWEMVHFDEDRLEFIHRNQVGVVFILEPARGSENEYRRVSRIELTWTGKALASLADHDRHLAETIDRFFFRRLEAKYRDRGFKAGGRVKDYVHQISSMWFLAQELRYEFLNLKRRFRVEVKVNEERHLMSVVAKLNGLVAGVRVGVEVVFELTGEEVLDHKSSSIAVVAGIGCRVIGGYGTADTEELTYVAREAIDQASERGALRKACEQTLKALETGER